MTAPTSTTCTPWCTNHDDETDRCVSNYRFTPLTLETPTIQFGETRPAQMHTVMETGPNGQPVIVTYPADGAGVTMTLAEAAAYIAAFAGLVASAGVMA